MVGWFYWKLQPLDLENFIEFKVYHIFFSVDIETLFFYLITNFVIFYHTFSYPNWISELFIRMQGLLWLPKLSCQFS